MKKILAIILVISLLVLSSGCDKLLPDFTQTSGDTQQAPATTEATENNAVLTPTQLPMTAVSLPVEKQEYTDNNGKTVYSHTYQNISLTVTDPEIADKIILDFLNRTDMQETVDALHKSAIEDSKNAGFLPYYTQITYTPARLDSSVLSMQGGYTEFTGWFHPNTHCATVTYDLVTGNLLSLDEIISQETKTDTMVQLLNSALSAQKDKLMGGYEKIVADTFAKGFAEVSNWYLSNEGLCFLYSPYEIGPYVSGIITAEIPYSQLNGILNDAYFPAERDILAGQMEGNVFNEAESQMFTQIAEVVLDKEGEKVLLYTKGGIYDLRLELGSYSADSQEFIPEQTVLASYTLTPGDAVMVQASFESDLPVLRLSYDSGGETITRFIALNGNTVTLK